MLKEIQAIVLAAHKSINSHGENTKLTEKICGQELILYPISLLQQLEIPTTIVIGIEQENIKRTVQHDYPDTHFIFQGDPKGSAHAVKKTKSTWDKEYILILTGDMPLITSRLIMELYQKHIETNADISFIWSHNGEPSGYDFNRVIEKNNQPYIIPANSLTHTELQNQCCISTGIYLVNQTFLKDIIDNMQAHEDEFSLAHLINIANETNKKITKVAAPFDQVRRIKNYQELWAAEQVKRSELIKYWMDHGVRFSAPQTVHIDLDVEIGSGTYIGCSVHLQNNAKIGDNCIIEHFSIIDHSTIGNMVNIKPHTIITNAIIKDHAQVGPFAHIQENSTIGSHSHIGNFVETKNSSIGDYSKAKHLSYLGTAKIGNHVNIGAGTITCNFDGTKKHVTLIKDHVFIGTNNSLVAPITIHEHAFTAAGSVITKDVPARALAIARAPQTNKEEYAEKLLKKDNDDGQKTSYSFMGAKRTNNDTNIL